MAEPINTENWKGRWDALGAAARAGLIIGASAVLALAALAAWWALATNYDVLFSQLNATDAAAIVEQLKHSKTPYEIADGGATIRVPAERVLETRIALMSSGAPLSGGVGFEIFDKLGLGTTEQSQRVAYQRALQGELARTIDALEPVKQARVHLALPEASLFRRDRQEPRAAVSLLLKPGALLDRDQVAGMQRLVAASIAGLEPSHVVITDQRGITLSGTVSLSGSGGIGAGEEQLSMKRDVEEYVTRKVVQLLDRTYGPGQAIVSVDVLLNFDEIHRTVQDLLPMNGAGAADPAVRRMRRASGASAPGGDLSWNIDGGKDSSTAHPSSASDVEYEYGRRVEQVIAAPGGVVRMSIGVIVPGTLSEENRSKIKDLVKMASGIDETRGDAIVVQPLDAVAAAVPVAGSTEHPLDTPVAPSETVPMTSNSVPPLPSPFFGNTTAVIAAAIAMALIFIVLTIAILGFRRRRFSPQAAALSSAERNQLLVEMHQALTGRGRRPDSDPAMEGAI